MYNTKSTCASRPERVVFEILHIDVNPSDRFQHEKFFFVSSIVRHLGDWLYVASMHSTSAGELAILQMTPDRVGCP
jgi:hypothetical protein